LLNNILQNIREGVAVLNSDGKIILWNKFLAELTGVSQELVFGKSAVEIANNLQLFDVADKISSIIKNNKKVKEFYLEKELTTATGDKIWVGITMSLIGATDFGNNIILVARDITREKELIRAKNEFISTTAHELRTPLTSVKGYLSMILQGDAGELNNLQGKYFTKAYLSTERLVGLVEDLLTVLRIEENKVALNIQSFNIDKVIRETIETFKNKADLKKIKIVYSKNKKVLAYGDSVKTKHIIENLVDNALKYTKHKGNILISIKSNDTDLIVSIKDSGVGIPSKHYSDIFERFVRVENPLSIKAGGTGLGLFIAKNLIEKQGGKIWLESKLREGTTFHFTIPLAIKSN
jgi:PAS domain S-box-containing protein